MKTPRISKFALLFLRTLCLIASSLLLPYAVQAQQCNGTICQGDNAVYNSQIQQSHSFIDASEITSAGGDVCVAINTALQQIQGNPGYYGKIGAVIDARGFSAPTITCSENPWTSLTAAPSATILLPTGIIQTHQTWVVPAFTRVVGQGACVPASGSCQTLTVIQAASNMSNSPLIMMGNDTGGGACPTGSGCQDPNCNAVGIEHLVLDGGSSSQGIGGILNNYSQELSYVNDVSMINLGGTGLTVGIGFPQGGGSSDGDGDNSGPYSNLYISTTGQCAQLAGTVVNSTTYTLNQTRGIHGLTCVTSATSGSAISINYSLNNILEDVSITGGGGGLHGIGIGSSGLASGNVLMNITGANVYDVVNISSANNTPSSTTCLGGNYACDITLAGISRGANTTYAIEDGLPPAGFNLSDTTVGLYIVGEPVGTGGIATSRFTTSNSIPNWLVGTNVPNNAACTAGDLFSDIKAAGGTYSLYACTNQSGTWTPVPHSN